MEFLRTLGNFTHALSLLALIHQVRTRKSSSGISLKSQCLFAVVHIAHYFGNLSYVPIWQWYNPGIFFRDLLKLFFVICSLCLLVLMTMVYKDKPEVKLDTFKPVYLVLVALVAAFFSPSEPFFDKHFGHEPLFGVGLLLVLQS
jgi:ER lumen protein retaining receptor